LINIPGDGMCLLFTDCGLASDPQEVVIGLLRDEERGDREVVNFHSIITFFEIIQFRNVQNFFSLVTQFFQQY
jgi:hypothetical protein